MDPFSGCEVTQVNSVRFLGIQLCREKESIETIACLQGAYRTNPLVSFTQLATFMSQDCAAKVMVRCLHKRCITKKKACLMFL